MEQRVDSERFDATVICRFGEVIFFSPRAGKTDPRTAQRRFKKLIRLAVSDEEARKLVTTFTYWQLQGNEPQFL